jgi:hypothetical protein
VETDQFDYKLANPPEHTYNMTSERENIDIRIENKQRQLVDHINNDHVGDSQGKIVSGCHNCNNIKQTILNMQSTKAIREWKQDNRSGY